MKSRIVSSHRPFLGAALLLAPLFGCGGGGGGQIALGQSGQVLAGSEPGKVFIVEESQSGNASSLVIQGAFWGRLVNVEVRVASDCAVANPADAAYVEIMRDFVIREDIQSTPGIYELDVNPITGDTRLRLLSVCEDDLDDPSFVTDVLEPLSGTLTPVAPRAIDDVLTFTRAPRNCALVLRFNDLIDPATVTPETVRVVAGNPPTNPFECRIVPDPNHGNIVTYSGGPRFFPTRIIIDPTVSTVEGEALGIPVNPLGFPPSVTVSQSNVAIRIPSVKDASLGQTALLRNRTGHPVTTNGNGPVDLSGTRDVIRALRSGGNTAVTGDPNNGFLRDRIAPRVIGAQPLVVRAVRNPASAPCFIVDQDPAVVAMDFDYAFPGCAFRPKIDDVVRQGSTVGVVVPQTIAAPTTAGEVTCLLVRVTIDPTGNGFQPGVLAEFLTPFDPDQDLAFAPCFVRYSPNVDDPAAPVVSTSTQLLVRFSEAMDPNSLTPFGSMAVTRSQKVDLDTGGTGFLPEAYVVGRVVSSPSLTDHAFLPSLPLAHRGPDHPSGARSETYYLNLGVGANGPTDLAGNPLEDALPTVTFNVDPTEPTERNGGFVMGFGTVSEFNAEPESIFANWLGNNADTDLLPEIRGQFLYDIARGRILPRPVNRISAVADRTQATISQMTTFVGGILTPLAPLGSKLQQVWRHVDFGWALTDEAFHNVDVEGLAWTPATGNVVPDNYEQFEIRLSHGRRLPDEYIDPASLFPLYPASGLLKQYDANLLADDDPVVVHPRGLGYKIDSVDLFPATTGTLMMPYPLNRTIPTSEFKYYTYRDTAIQSLGGPNGAGSDPRIMETVAPSNTDVGRYPPNEVPTIGLPLLMEYRCFPTSLGVGQNALDISLGANSSSTPNFRAFSTGGINQSGATIVKNPDAQTQATGGFNPGSNPPGAGTPGLDNTVYIGQMDVVIRLSRIHSIWFPALDADGQHILAPHFLDPIIEPSSNALPQGTSVQLAFRGSSMVTGNQLRNAALVDFYGGNNPQPDDALPGQPGMVTFPAGETGPDITWKSEMSQIDGMRYFQFRATFISNTETALTAELTSLGFAYSD